MSGLRGVIENPLLSVVMPVFNERATIEEIISRVSRVPIRTELIVVDDGSTDGTRDVLQALQRERGFQLVLQPKNQGKGAALRRGFQDVTGDLVLIEDADLEVLTRGVSRADRAHLPGPSRCRCTDRAFWDGIACSSSRTIWGTGC